jgi:hypothetical protein
MQTDYFCQFSRVLDVGSLESAEHADAIRDEPAAELVRHEGAVLGVKMDVDRETGPGALWIHADEYGEPEHVTRFVLRCAEAFDLEGAWGFCWSLTCSKPRIEGFGGGGLVLDLAMRETVATIDCADWLAHQLTDPGELAEQRQQEATKENGPQPEWKGD